MRTWGPRPHPTQEHGGPCPTCQENTGSQPHPPQERGACTSYLLYSISICCIQYLLNPIYIRYTPYTSVAPLLAILCQLYIISAISQDSYTPYQLHPTSIGYPPYLPEVPHVYNTPFLLYLTSICGTPYLPTVPTSTQCTPCLLYPSEDLAAGLLCLHSQHASSTVPASS